MFSNNDFCCIIINIRFLIVEGDFTRDDVIKDIKDNSYKKVFENPELFCQFLKGFSNVEILKDIESKDISDCTDRFIPLFFEEKDSDTVKVVEVKKDIFIIALIEHQSKVCYDMAFRMLLYMSLIWHEWVKEKENNNKGISKTKGFKLPPILPIVYYTGTETWTAELNFKDLIYLKEAFDAYIPDFGYELVQLKDYSIESLMNFGDVLSFVMMIDKIKSPEQIKQILGKITDEYIEKMKEKVPENLLELLRDIIFLFLKRINVSEGERKKVEELIYQRRFDDMFEGLAGYDVQKVRKEVREEVTKEVTERDNINFVKILSNLGHTAEEISKVTGFTIDRVKEILETN